MARILIFDGAPAKAQRAIEAHGGPSNAAMFERALSLHATGLDCFALNVADGERLPQGIALDDFDGIVITGSPLSVYKRVPEVTRQIELAHQAFESEVPTYGSCWGMQLMTAALGGSVRRNPQGREIGIARNIALTSRGRDHLLFKGKADAFDALCSHQDEVATLPQGARVLAGNGTSAIQAAEIDRGPQSFLGLQYHPEHTLATTAAIIAARMERLVAEGFARSLEDMQAVVADLRALDADPGRRDLAWRLGLDRHVLDPLVRTAEFGNWLRAKVLPRRALRAAAASA
jgi:GMP synthase (glutamine-hydrolysing)